MLMVINYRLTVLGNLNSLVHTS